MTDEEPSGGPWRRGYELMLEEARRALDGQRDALNSIRGRASWNLTAAGSAAGLFISLSDRRGVFAIAALFTALVIAMLSLAVLRPRSFDLEMDPYAIREWMYQARDTDEMVDALALRIWDTFVANEKVLGRLYDAYLVGCVLFLIEVGLFGLDVVVH